MGEKTSSEQDIFESDYNYRYKVLLLNAFHFVK